MAATDPMKRIPPDSTLWVPVPSASSGDLAAVASRLVPEEQNPSPTVNETDDAWSEADLERLRAMIGGKAGIIDGAIPALLFVAGNAIWSLTIGASIAGAYGLATIIYRASRRQPIRHALIGFAGLAFSLGIALVTRNANTYFVPGAALGALSGVIYLLTVVFRQPMSVLIAQAVERKDRAHYRRPEVHRMHMIVTSVWGVVFLARAAFRSYLIANEQTELLGASALALGYPVTAALLGWTTLYLRRGSRRLEPIPSETASDS